MKKNKKILILVNYLSFFVSHRLPVAEALLDDGIDVFIGYGDHGGANPKLLQERGFKLIIYQCNQEVLICIKS